MPTPCTELILTSSVRRMTLTHIGSGAIRVDASTRIRDRRCPDGYWRPIGYATAIRPDQLDATVTGFDLVEGNLEGFRAAIAENIAYDPFAGVTA